MFSRESIVASARGNKKVDTLIRNVQLVNVFTAEVYLADIGITEDRFSVIARYEAGEPVFNIDAEAVIDGTGKYAMPGFVDCHVHNESTMVTPEYFSRALLERGTTTAVTDPHEMANVLGKKGIDYMIEASKDLPVNILITVPSSVPAVPGLETSGAEFNADDISELLDREGVVGIAEIMDYIGVINQSERMAGIVQKGLDKNMLNEGHIPRATGRDLQAYLAAGVDTDHESRTTDEIIEKLRAGMLIYIRESSASQFADIAAEAWEVLPYVENIAMCTDDVEAHDMLHNGQMNRVVRRCIEEGIPAPLAIRFASLSGAKRFNLRDSGAIAPGYFADFSLTDSLETIDISDVFIKGEHLVENSRLRREVKSHVPALDINTVDIPELGAETLEIKAPFEKGKIQINTLEMTQIGTTVRGQLESNVEDFKIGSLPEEYVYAAVIGRHGQNKDPFVGIVKNAGMTKGAYATTVAHDSHNLIVLGKNTEDMIVAAQHLEKVGGGLCLADNGEVKIDVKLPIGGLMADKSIDELGPEIENFNKVALEMGVKVGRRSPSMALSSLALTVIPEIRLSDLGLVDVVKQELIPLFDVD